MSHIFIQQQNELLQERRYTYSLIVYKFKLTC